MYLQFSPEVIAAVYTTNTATASTLAELMRLASVASEPIPAGADPVSVGLSAAFKSYKSGYYNITDNGISKFHEGNGKLPESIHRYEFGDSAGGARVKSAEPGIVYI
ncbi:hypothetical protein J2W56_002753 [Nocardia kruczakiae]|jgi:hypothetical protein|uniref:PE domain-containing protein n=2 Tax=Nocardia TaxID=1817 RepID=A0A231GSZ9_9NOCA|nr:MULTISPECIES: PE domain-containing protein [Nocardia]MDR7169012.1 hypothetical protein [Nocardia kruczakiae]OXR39708.1 hypothetical protein B7C42_08222 [Nocardia cerradoensis]